MCLFTANHNISFNFPLATEPRGVMCSYQFVLGTRSFTYDRLNIQGHIFSVQILLDMAADDNDFYRFEMIMPVSIQNWTNLNCNSSITLLLSMLVGNPPLTLSVSPALI